MTSGKQETDNAYGEVGYDCLGVGLLDEKDLNMAQ